MIKFEQDIHLGHAFNTMNDVHAWITRTHNNLISAGCVQTNDTGQYAAQSGSSDNTTASIIGYRIYELNDAYSSQTPVYFKLEFQVLNASSSTNIRFGRINVTVGFKTDGVGNISNSNVSKILKSYGTGGTSAFIPNPNARTLSVKGDDFFFHGNELCAGHQTTTNIYECGHFAIVRSKINGVVNPNTVTFIYSITSGTGSTQGTAATDLRYTRLTKDNGISAENHNIFRIPRIRNQQGLLVASEADISENAILETTDRLIAFRATSDDTPWVEHKLSIDGLTEKKYLHIPTAFSATAPNTLSVSNIYLCSIVDSAEIGIGAMGLLIDE